MVMLLRNFYVVLLLNNSINEVKTLFSYILRIQMKMIFQEFTIFNIIDNDFKYYCLINLKQVYKIINHLFKLS